MIQRWSRTIWFLSAYVCGSSTGITWLFLVRIHPQYFSSIGKTLIQPQSDLYVAFQDERAKDVCLRGILKVREYWISPPPGNIYIKRSCCSTLKWAFCFCKKNNNKKFRTVQENIASFYLLVSFAGVKNFSIALLIILLANSHCLIYKITARTNRHVCLLSEDLNSREFKKQILY